MASSPALQATSGSGGGGGSPAAAALTAAAAAAAATAAGSPAAAVLACGGVACGGGSRSQKSPEKPALHWQVPRSQAPLPQHPFSHGRTLCIMLQLLTAGS